MEIHYPSGPKRWSLSLAGGGRYWEVSTVSFDWENFGVLDWRSVMGGGRLREVVAHGGSTVFRLRQITLHSICRIVHIIKSRIQYFLKIIKTDTEKCVVHWVTVCHILPTDWLFIQENRFWRRSVMTGVGRCGQYQGNKESNGQINEDVLNQLIVSSLTESIKPLFGNVLV